MSKKSFSLNLRTEILLNLVIIMVFSMLLLSIMVLKFSRDIMAEKLREKHIQYALEIQRYMDILKSKEKTDESINSLIDYLKEMEKASGGIEFALFMSTSDENKLVLGKQSLNSESINKKINDLNSENLSKFTVNPTLHFSRLLGIVSKLKSIETLIPLGIYGSNKYMAYIVGGEVSQEKGFKRVKLMVVMYTIIFAFIMIIFGYVMISRSVINPLEKISKSASKIASGDLNEQIKTEQSNEIGDLARSIGKMTKTLLSNQSDLKKHLGEVEKLNAALKEAQREIVRVEKLASVGRLSSGIAHEIGNPLSAIVGYVDILKKELKAESEIDLLERSEKELQRISRIIKQLLDFSRPTPSEHRDVDLAKCIANVIDSLEKQGVFKGIKIDFKNDGDVGNVYIDEDQLRQILLNILNNASDAINDKFKRKAQGEITVRFSLSSVKDLEELKNASLFKSKKRKSDPPEINFVNERLKRRKEDPPESRFFTRRAQSGLGYPKFIFDENEQLVKITIEDNGSGIEDADIQKIFDPFYTTKDPGKGTGLGLYMTANTVENMGGYIDVISESGKGTLFLLLFPKSSGFC